MWVDVGMGMGVGLYIVKDAVRIRIEGMDEDVVSAF